MALSIIKRADVFNAVGYSDFLFIYVKPSVVSALCLNVYKYLSFEAILLLLTVASDLKCQCQKLRWFPFLLTW